MTIPPSSFADVTLETIQVSGLVPTEQLNPNTAEIDAVDTLTMLTLINDEDARVALAVRQALPAIAAVVDAFAERFVQGGRLFYVGAGTSGRLGVLDASECPPTFGTEPHQVQGIIAGGETALRNAVEGAEDNAEQGAADMLACQPNSLDVVVGISASGNAPYVIAALKTARKQGAYTACIACNPNAGMISVSDQAIVAEVGPEVVAGSTRLKAGTAQKLILNMITTGTMIRTGKTYGNWMVDVRPTNIKLRQRAVRIVSALAEVSPEQAVETLQHCANDVKRSVLVARFGLSSEEAGTLLSRHGGRLRLAMSELNQSQ